MALTRSRLPHPKAISANPAGSTNNMSPPHLEILDTLHNVPMPIHDAMKLLPVVHELTERDTYVTTVTMKNGYTYMADELSWLMRDVRVGLTLCPQFNDQVELIHANPNNPVGILTEITRTTSVRVDDVQHATLVPS